MPNGAGGGGGGGTIVGASNSFTGPAKSLEILGDFAYAYSGVVGVANTELALIDAHTGNFSLMARVQAFSSMTANERYIIRIKLNEITVLETITHLGTPNPQYSDQAPFLILIPSYTDLEITLVNQEEVNTNNWTVSVTGRIYRG